MNSQQQSSNRPLSLDRLRVARIASGVGAGALAASGISLAAGGEITTLTGVLALIGIGGLALWMSLAPDDFRSLITGRQAVYGSNSILSSVLVVAITVLVYWLSSGSGVAVDLTSLRYYSLKSDVRPVLQNLSQPIQITAFYTRLNLGAKSAEAPILRMFQDAAPDKVRIVYVDPDEQPLVAQNFNLTESYGIYVSYLLPSGAPDTRANSTVKMRGTFANEKWIAEAILQLQAQGKFKIAFSIGGGEISIDTDATGIRDGLTNVGIQVGTIDLANQDLNAEVTALVILGRWSDFDEAQTAKIGEYLAGGGKLLLMAEPGYDSRVRLMNSDDSPLAKYLWQTWGIRPHHDIVFDPVSYDTSSYYVRAARYLEGHPIVSKDETGTAARPLFVIAQSWEVTDAPNVSAKVIYQTSDEAFGKTNLQEVAANPDRAVKEITDVYGPLNLVVAAENTVNGARVVVMGDSDWVRNDQIVAFDGQYLWTNLIDWLTNFLERITVNPVSIGLPLNVSGAELNLTNMISVLILPGVVLLTGILIWWRRSHR